MTEHKQHNIFHSLIAFILPRLTPGSGNLCGLLPDRGLLCLWRLWWTGELLFCFNNDSLLKREKKRTAFARLSSVVSLFLQVLVWKSNLVSTECNDGVRVQHKATSQQHSLQAPPAGSTAHHASNSLPSVVHSQVSSDSWSLPPFSRLKEHLMPPLGSLMQEAFHLGIYRMFVLFFSPHTPRPPCLCFLFFPEHQHHFSNALSFSFHWSVAFWFRIKQSLILLDLLAIFFFRH